jgi:hypothetical protein
VGFDTERGGSEMGFETKQWACRCPVCKTDHTVEAEFMSGSQYADGAQVLSCGEHSAEELQAAFVGRRSEEGERA